MGVLIQEKALDWLLQPDKVNPGVRYFALRDLLNLPAQDPQVTAARQEIMQTGPVPSILDAQYPEGYWVKPGAGYAPKYRGTLWQIIFLAQFGADGSDEQVARAVEYALNNAATDQGAFSCQINARPSGVIHCLWGNMLRALLDLGYAGDPRVMESADYLARSVTGDEYERYMRSGIQAPGFYCSANYDLPCGWGAVRVLLALNRVPPGQRTPAITAAIKANADFLLSYDIARADYPFKDRINSSWFKFGYPLGYVTDVLLNLEALVEAGCGNDPRLKEAADLVRSRQDDQGHWSMEYSYNGKMWIDVEQKGKPSKWVTLRALRVLSRIGEG